jgi:hypothetical protein
MLLSEVFTRAKVILASGKERDAYFALLESCAGDTETFYDALNALDALVADSSPDALSFVMWADGGELVRDGEHERFAYDYDRRLPEVLALLSTAARRAMHGESGA